MVGKRLKRPRIRKTILTSISDLSVVVRERRKELNLSIVQVAEFAGTSRFFVSDLEKGKPSVQFDKVMAVLKTLQLKVELKAGAPRSPRKAAQSAPPEPTRARVPAVAVERTHDDAETVACLECGVRVRNLQKHLSTTHSMRTADYRRRWALLEDYDIRPRAVSEQADRRRKLRDALAR